MYPAFEPQRYCLYAAVMTMDSEQPTREAEHECTIMHLYLYIYPCLSNNGSRGIFLAD
jgi:hypothetical protein